MIQLHNTLTGKLEPFEPLAPGRVSMYVCGPTVYGLLHIGNGRTFMAFDVIRRYLEYRGLAVTYVQNFTDIDDKIINRAAQEHTTPEAVAEKYTEAYREDMAALGVHAATVHPHATACVPEMIAHVEGLLEKGLAYAVDGDVYYRVRRFDGYGRLSGRTPDQLRSGARIEIDPRKEDPLDFALWKAAKPGEPAWQAPWGLGRPGWHIECSAMAAKHLGETIDLHCGGMDLKFPHHENEIAQSEGLTGKPFARYWLHTGFLNMDAEKMSKSLGNVKTVREMVAAYGATALRVFMLGTHYRQELDFSEAGIQSALAGWKRLVSGLAPHEDALAPSDDPRLSALLEAAESGFTSAMDLDFNTPRALAHFNVTASALKKLEAAAPELAPSLGLVVERLARQAEVLGLSLTVPVEPAAPAPTPAGQEAELIALLIGLRQEAKAAKNWAMADRIRDGLRDLGIRLIDQKDGTTTHAPAEPAAR